MSPIARKITYAVSFEVLGLGLSTLAVLLMSDASAAWSFGLSVAFAVMALAWNLLFNSLFERWEAGRIQRGRSTRRRIAHAMLFEAGFTVLTLPVVIWTLDTGFWHGLAYDLTLTLVFMVYTYLFTWAFDALFGLPKSAT